MNYVDSIIYEKKLCDYRFELVTSVCGAPTEDIDSKVGTHANSCKLILPQGSNSSDAGLGGSGLQSLSNEQHHRQRQRVVVYIVKIHPEVDFPVFPFSPTFCTRFGLPRTTACASSAFLCWASPWKTSATGRAHKQEIGSSYMDVPVHCALMSLPSALFC